MRRAGLALILVSSLAMTCTGLAIVPSADVSYQTHLTTHSQTLDLEARPAPQGQTADRPTVPLVPAELARFDGVLIASVPATGRLSTSGAPTQIVATPTQPDVDRAASPLQQQLLALGQSALLAQQHPGDLIGPPFGTPTVTTFPAVDTALPAGVQSFQVAVALHLRAVLVRQSVLFQTASTLFQRDVSQHQPGLALEAAPPPHLTLLNDRIANTGDGALALRLRVQITGLFGPALTPNQVRSAISGLSIQDALHYLSQQSGISHVSIHISPEWLNRLPIFSARIRINIESEGSYAPDWA